MRAKSRALIKIFGATLTAALSFVVLYGAFLSESPLKNYGLLSVFLAALFSHLTIVARGFFVPLFLSLVETYGPLALGLSAGLGGALGEVAAYYWGRGIKEALSPDERRNPLPRWAERYGLLVALIFAASPLPDTPIILLAGLLRFPLWKLMLVQVAGKSTLYFLGAVIGGFILMGLKSIVEDVIASTIILIASVVLCIIVSWSKSRERILQILEKMMNRFGVKLDS
ncbi:VTT domain-containing protein [Candidatus Bathyarchaeota archaeon]|nr:VTT domain-containing protein [Candidatus Bathyarchaeota archaeon]